MKYKTYLKQTYTTSTEQILYGRGITDINAWLNANINDIASWRTLCNIDWAVSQLRHIIEENLNVCIIVDCDVDGYTSAAILINFLYSLFPD